MTAGWTLSCSRYIEKQAFFEHLGFPMFEQAFMEYIRSDENLMATCRDMNFEVGDLMSVDYLPKLYLIVAVDKTDGYSGKTIQLLGYRLIGHAKELKNPELRRLIRSKKFFICVLATLPPLYRIYDKRLLSVESVVNHFFAKLCSKLKIRNLNLMLSRVLPPPYFEHSKPVVLTSIPAHFLKIIFN